MSLRRAHSLALRAELRADQGRRTGSEKQLREARQLHAQASLAFKEAGDMKQARYHQRKATELYYEIHRHDPDPADPYHRGANPTSPELFDYSSRVAVGGAGLSPWEAAAVVGGATVVLGVLAYWSIKSTVSTVVSAPVAPVPTPTPVQPVSPSNPGY